MSTMSAFTLETITDVRTIRAPGSTWTFRRRADRWLHEFGFGAGDPFASSVEADPAAPEANPSEILSPTFQDLQWHPEVAPKARALLTGQATYHHFSAVVAASIRPDGLLEWEIDVADRCRGEIAALTSTYIINASSSDLIDAAPDRIAWNHPKGRIDLTVSLGATLALAEAGRRTTRLQIMAKIDPRSNTQRYIYRWRWTPTAV